MAPHGMLNGRMKDIYDVQALATRLTFDGRSLAEAVRLTFERRGRPIGEELPAPLTHVFARHWPPRALAGPGGRVGVRSVRRTMCDKTSSAPIASASARWSQAEYARRRPSGEAATE